ncbi:MAG: LamB/YcsF family protein [Verrucomicrobia bacterium]|nr:LamB/YcsF family protein [Verrucomicrobiota bacterium]
MNPRKSIDLNCDLGEGAGHDAELMPWITSANIACGAHAGDEATMRATVALAQKHGVAIGAHPGFADRENFGRVELDLPPAGIRTLVMDQVARLQNIVALRHVKPHGALYNLAARDAAVAKAVADAVRAVDPGLVLFALAGSRLASAGEACGLRVAHEVFADRTYQRDGTLTPRTRPDALIKDQALVTGQVLSMIKAGCVFSTEGDKVSISADTLCLHGDGVHAVEFARALRAALANAEVDVKAFGP